MSENSENNEQRFQRLAELRTNAILDKVRLLGNLANRRVYSYSDEDIDKIFSAINQQIKEVRMKFHNQKPQRFKLR